MISLQFNLRIPGSNRFNNIKCWHGPTPFNHQFWELQVYQSADIVDMFVRITRNQSHAGLHMGIGLAGFNVEFQIYDIRHWNSETHRWQT